MSRYFFALDIPAQDKITIAQLQQQLDLPFKAVTAENFHITLAFLGQISERQKQILCNYATKLSTINHQSQPYTLTLDQSGLFKKARVVYLSSTEFPVNLAELANALSTKASELDLFKEKRAYHPHLTLFRKATKAIEKPTKIDIIIKINSFSLYESKSTPIGVKYQSVANWQLSTPQ